PAGPGGSPGSRGIRMLFAHHRRLSLRRPWGWATQGMGSSSLALPQPAAPARALRDCSRKNLPTPCCSSLCFLIEIDQHPVCYRKTLTAQDEAASDLIIFEREIGVHIDLPLHHLAAAGGAHPPFA